MMAAVDRRGRLMSIIKRIHRARSTPPGTFDSERQWAPTPKPGEELAQPSKAADRADRRWTP